MLADEIKSNITKSGKVLKEIQANAAAVQDSGLEKLAKMRLKDGKGNLVVMNKATTIINYRLCPTNTCC
eukprot:5014820-Ditylum_brightwellii.AAC.1